MLYSKSTGSFYDPEIHAAGIPGDAVEITRQKHATLMKGQAQGKVIQADDKGYPVLVDPPKPTLDQLASAAESARSIAYMREADPLFFKAQRGEATMDEWRAKVSEIKKRYPDPA